MAIIAAPLHPCRSHDAPSQCHLCVPLLLCAQKLKQLCHCKLALGSPASVVAHAKGPVAFDMPWIVYSEEDKCTLDMYVCKMGVRGFPYFLYLILMKIYSLMYTQ